MILIPNFSYSMIDIQQKFFGQNNLQRSSDHHASSPTFGGTFLKSWQGPKTFLKRSVAMPSNDDLHKKTLYKASNHAGTSQIMMDSNEQFNESGLLPRAV